MFLPFQLQLPLLPELVHLLDLLLADVDHDGVPPEGVETHVSDPKAAQEGVLGGHQGKNQHQQKAKQTQNQTI